MQLYTLGCSDIALCLAQSLTCNDRIPYLVHLGVMGCNDRTPYLVQFGVMRCNDRITHLVHLGVMRCSDRTPYLVQLIVLGYNSILCAFGCNGM